MSTLLIDTEFIKKNRPGRSLLLLVLLLLLAIPLHGQCILVLEKAGNVKNYKYSLHDEIMLKLKGQQQVVKGRISRMQDTVLILDYQTTVCFSDIDAVVRKRKGFVILSSTFFHAGLAYGFIDALNRVINHENPVFQQDVMQVSGALVLAGLGFGALGRKKCPIGKEWRLKVLDFSKLK